MRSPFFAYTLISLHARIIRALPRLARFLVLALCLTSAQAAAADTGRMYRSICETDAMGATRCYTLSYDNDVTARWDRARAHWMHACLLERSQQPRKLSDLFVECQEEFVEKQVAYTDAGATPEQFATVFQDLAGFAVKCRAEYEAEHRDEIPSQAAGACQFRADWLENRWLTAQAAKR